MHTRKNTVATMFQVLAYIVGFMVLVLGLVMSISGGVLGINGTVMLVFSLVSAILVSFPIYAMGEVIQLLQDIADHTDTGEKTITKGTDKFNDIPEL